MGVLIFSKVFLDITVFRNIKNTTSLAKYVSMYICKSNTSEIEEMVI